MYALPPKPRRVLVVVHVIAGVAVIGDVWGLALMHWVALSSGSADVSRTAFRFTTAMVFAGGIPFSFLSLLSGLALVLFGKWSLRQTWIWVKLALQLGILATGALFIRPILLGAQPADLAPSHRDFLILMAVQGTSLIAATALSVFKPGSRRRRKAVRADAVPVP